MTEAKWLVCQDAQSMLKMISDGRTCQRKCRLFGCAVCRRIWGLMADSRSREAVQATEQFADGFISEHQLDLLSGAAEEAFEDFLSEPGGDDSPATSAAYAASYASSPSLPRTVLEEAINAAAKACTNHSDEERAAQVSLLRDIFGNPFHPVTFLPAWRTGTAVAIACQMYESRDFSAMPILADALQDAGCASDDILSHCREPGEHVRGCWVVDFVLGLS